MNTPENQNKPNAGQRASRLMDALMDGRLSPETEERIRNWFRQPGNLPGKMAALEESFAKYVPEERHPDREDYDAFRALCRRLEIPQETLRNKSWNPAQRKASIPLGRRLGRIAAIMVPLIVLAGAAFLLLNRPAEVPLVSVTASAGMQEQILLPDGSTVWLNPNGMITYPERFSGNERTVALTGEAFFRVARDEKRPFSVDAEQLTVIVLGTEFQIRANPYEQRSTVTLHSGSVQVDAGEQHNRLQPGEKLAYYHQSGETEVFEVELEDWTKPSMDFYYQTLPEIFNSIEANYNVNIGVRGKLGTTPYTLQFIRKENLEDVLRKLQELTREFTYRIDGENIEIITNQ